MSETPSIYPAWGKTPRIGQLFMTITEKIDGTNALVDIREVSDPSECRKGAACVTCTDFGVDPSSTKYLQVRAGSRTRWISLDSDNFGFARWVHEHATELVKLGHGRHYGEWWGAGIGRRYDQTQKHFSIFNTRRPAETLPSCVRQVPLLYTGAVDFQKVEEAKFNLELMGSTAAPGFMKPEGLVVWVAGERYKVVFENEKNKTREERVA